MHTSLHGVLESMGVHNGLEVEERPVEKLIDYNVVKVLSLCDLVAGIG